MPLQSFVRFDSRLGLVSPLGGLVSAVPSLEKRLKSKYKGPRTRANARKRLEGVLASVVANALVAELKGKDVSYSRSNARKARSLYEEDECLSLGTVDTRDLVTCVDSLCADGFLSGTKAPRNSLAVHYSTYRATEKLLREFRNGDLSSLVTYEKEAHRFVKLKPLKGDSDAPLIFGETHETRNLERLARMWASVNATYRTTHPVETVLGYEWFTSQFVFKGDWHHHGRFYHPLSRWPRDVRRDLKVDGEATCEYDFRALHLTLLYAIETEALPKGDVYLVPAYPYDLHKEYGRQLAKIVANVGCINSGDLSSAGKAVRGRIYGCPDENDTWQETRYPELRDWIRDNSITINRNVIEEFVKAHGPVRDYFFADNGLILQRIESRILEKVLDAFVCRGLWIVPYHDSFRVKEGHSALLLRTMQEAFKEVTGVALPSSFITKKD